MIAVSLHPELSPVRALNQVTYCPRLYCLQYVEGLMVTNEHVEDGILKHGRVNDPRIARQPRKERDAMHACSVSMASEQLGLTSKLELIDEQRGEVYPLLRSRSLVWCQG